MSIGLQNDFPIIAVDDEVFDQWVKDLAAEFRRRRPVSGYGIAISEQPSGTVVECTIDPPRLRHAVTRVAGIGAATSVTQMTSAVVDIWRPNSTGLLTAAAGEEATAWNKAPGATGAIAGNKHIMLLTDDAGLEIVVVDLCP